MDAYLTSGSGFELDYAFGIGDRRRRDQLDEFRPAPCLLPPRFGCYKKPFQFAGVQTQLLGGPVNTLLPGGTDSQLP
jgi:hypothetical protein